jgi:hypothetical protein
VEHLRDVARRGSGTFDEVTADLNKEVEEQWRKDGKGE